LRSSGEGTYSWPSSPAQLVQRLGELAVGVVGGVLGGPPHVIAKLAALAQPPQFLKQDLQADETVDGDLVTPPLRRRWDQDTRLQPCLDGCPGDPEQTGSHRDGHAGQFMPAVGEQNLSCIPDLFPVKPARGHVLQESDIGDDLLGMVIFASDGHAHLPLN